MNRKAAEPGADEDRGAVKILSSAQVLKELQTRGDELSKIQYHNAGPEVEGLELTEEVLSKSFVFSSSSRSRMNIEDT